MWNCKRISLKLFPFLSFIHLTLLTQMVIAQEDTLNIYLNDNFSTRLRLEGSMLFGIGLSDHQVGITTDNKDVMMSGGGGIGGILILGYGISPKWDISFGIGIQNSSLVPAVENASASFLRTILLTNIKYRIPVSFSGLINLGGGISYYFPGDMDVDISNVSGGGHNIYGYDNSTGLQFLAEYEGFFSKDFSWIIGLKYSEINYDIKSAQSNGMNIPIDQLPEEIKDEIGNLDGSSVDLVLSLIYYF